MSAEADKATESAAPSFREGPPASLNLYDPRDMRLLNMKLRDWWEGSLSELHEWSEAIRDVRETTTDEKVLLAGGAVAATITRAFADSYAKANGKDAPGVTHNTQVNIDARGGQELVAELKKQLTLAEREKLLEQLESGTGGNGNGKH